MENSLFREKNLKRISSPESLNEYMRVTTPGVWTVLIAIILLLVGVCCWGIFGKLDTKVDALVMSSGTNVYAIVEDENSKKIEAGDELSISGRTYTVLNVGTDAFELNKDESSYLLHLLGKNDNCWVVLLTISDTYIDENGKKGFATLPEGSYEGYVTVDSVSPLSFVTN